MLLTETAMGAALSVSPNEPLPRWLGPYRICRVLGAGGMATVYVACDTRLCGVHQLVALKCMHPHLAPSRPIAEMFADEGRVACAIAHPNVCRVSCYGSHEGVRFLAMEYLCGHPLSAVSEAFAVDPGLSASRRVAFAARILYDACEGLHALHELKSADGRSWGAVHRDVSPDNVMVTCAGAVKIMDLGMVKAAGQRHQTEAGVIKGKLSYVAPELLAGAPADRRADVWALGVIAWELFTGQRLFRRSRDTDTIVAISHGAIEPPSRCAAGIGAGIDAVIARALDRDPARRHRTARELGQALARAAAGLPESADLGQWLSGAFGHDGACYQRALDAAMAEATPSAPAGPIAAGRAPARRSRRSMFVAALVAVLMVLALGATQPSPAGGARPAGSRAAAAARGAQAAPGELSIEIRQGGRLLWRAPFTPPAPSCSAGEPR